MFKPNKIQVGITTECNGLCDKKLIHCNRSFINNNILDPMYKISHMNLEILKPLFNIYSPKELILIGSLGDACMHPGLLEFLKYLLEIHPKLSIIISTNGSMNNNEWWKTLATILSVNSKVIFCLDGLSGVHEKYRGVSYDKVISNAKSFIGNGGTAIWQFIVFNHNQHQLKDAESLSIDLGFSEFSPIISFTYNDNLSLPDGVIDYRKGIDKFKRIPICDCPWKQKNMIYITESGEVMPCCNIWPAFVPVLNSSVLSDDVLNLYKINKNKLNLNDNSIEDILDNEFFEYIYSNVDNINQCIRCCGVREDIKNCLCFDQVKKFLR